MTSADELKDEIKELREKGHQFVNDEISRGDFKKISGGRGVYAQKEKGKFMIRIRTTSGIVTREHLRRIISYTDKYKLDNIRLTTRQAVQLHELSIDDVCDIMYDAIDYDLFTRGSGGNFPRNVTLSPLSGVDSQEVFDVTPFSAQVGEYFQNRITTYKLPRKFKVAFSSTLEDTGCAAINDVGFIAVKKDNKPYFQLYLGGGLGGGPAVAVAYPKLVEPERILYYVEAMINLFRGEGDYQNRGKARSRFIVRRMGVEAFLACFDKYLEEAERTQKFEGIQAQLVKKEDWKPELDIPNLVIPQRQKNLYTLVIHPLGGLLPAEEGKRLLEFMSDKDKAALRLAMNQDMFVRNLTKEEVIALMEMVKHYNQVDMIGKTITCVGTPTCQIGIQQSQKLIKDIAKAMEDAQLSGDCLPRIQVNGCLNSCSRHYVASLGFAGFITKVEGKSTPCFYLYIGGSVGTDAKLGQKMGAIAAERIPQFIVELVTLLKNQDTSYEEYCKTDEFNKLLESYLV
jgi:sulfite reductase beta subunit-like hemoprotein